MNHQSEHKPATMRDFIQLTKPGILRSNLFIAFAGFWLASRWNIDWLLLIYVLIGTTLVVASSCVFNNYLDRDFDAKMARTRHRALPSGRITTRTVLLYGSVLGVAGVGVLMLTHWLAVLSALFGMFVYVVVYTAWLKRTSTLSTVMGAFSGSMPPLIGYVAVSGELDLGALLLFAVLFLWQPPHFWALGVRRADEYREAGFKILPVVHGIRRTKLQMLPYIVLLIPVSSLLYVYDYAGVFYLIAALVLGVAWLALSAAGLKAKNDERWARATFLFSINYLMVTFIVMILDTPKL